ncbi:DUF6515 family protein [Psychromonas sp. SP041]|uniref:DUF6515 family protein n=1 Tax=Psychromonas sp. SP041 TaxID=1365007 RepID=UPI00040FD239|nr:DUF6515 family protein [Psychromonas sp. SP041]
MKLAFLLPIVISLIMVFPSISSAESRDNKKHQKRSFVHKKIESKTDKITRKRLLYGSSTVLPKNRAARHKENRLDKKNAIRHKNSKTYVNRNIHTRAVQKNRSTIKTSVLPPNKAVRNKQKAKRLIAAKNLKTKRSKSFRKRAIYKIGLRSHKLPRNGRRLSFGGLSFIFSSGLYYRYLNNGYTVVHPPVGLKIRYLPHGFENLFVNGHHYYFFQGIYYITAGAYYQVVEAPFNDTTTLSVTDETQYEQQQSDYFELGQRYSVLPEGAELVVVNGEQYFKYQNIYFLPQSSDNDVDYLAVKLD